MKNEAAAKSLVALGLSRYQARVYSALSSLGPSGVSAISRASGVPRTKTYEVLEQLSKMGSVDFQAGRPALYSAASPSLLVRQLRDQYMASADEAIKSLESERPHGHEISERDLVWTFRGENAIRRKLSETIAATTSKLTIVEPYPARLINSVATSLRSSRNRGVKVRAACLVEKDQTIEARSKLIEYRRFLAAPRAGGDRFDEILGSLHWYLHRFYCTLMVDDSQALIALIEGPSQSETLGILFKMRPIPMLQRILFEELIRRMTVPA